MNRVIVPSGAGVGSAIGFLRAPLAYEVVRSRRLALDAFDAEEANSLIDEMTAEATAVILPGLGAGLSIGEPKRQLHLDIRYVGQGYELAIPWDDRPFNIADAARIKAMFEDRYKAVYGVTLGHVGIEITAWSLVLSVATSADRSIAYRETDPSVEPAGTREVYDPGHGKKLPFALYRREVMSPGIMLDGPAIIAEDQTSTIVPAGWRASIAPNHAIVLDWESESR